MPKVIESNYKIMQLHLPRSAGCCLFSTCLAGMNVIW